MARLPPSRHPLHCGLRIPDLRARDDSPLRGSCHHALPAICLTRRLPAQRIRRCGLNATFRTRLQQCDGDWSPLSPRCYRVAHAARLGTDTEICDTVRLVLIPLLYLKGVSTGDFEERSSRCLARTAVGSRPRPSGGSRRLGRTSTHAGASATSRPNATSIFGPMASTCRLGSKKGPVPTGHHRRHTGRQEGTRRSHRWRARERTILEGTAPRPQAAHYRWVPSW